MQTFLPYKDYHKAMGTLDPDRLGNQVYREGKYMLTCTRPGYVGKSPWATGVLARMWKPYRYQLALYCLAGAEIMAERQWHQPEVIERWLNYFKGAVDALPRTEAPPWIGKRRLHSSHRAALLYKNEEWYRQFGWTEDPVMEYFWPNV